MGNILDKGSVLDRIKQCYNLKGNADLARFLGVAPNTITNWYGRSTFDLDVIYTKCVGIDFDWLLTGHGSMLRSDQKQPIPQPVASLTFSTEEPYIYKMYQDQLKVAQEEKEENKTLIKENGRLEERVRTLEEKISTYQDKEPDSPTAASLVTEAFTEEPSGDSTKDYIHTRKPTTTKRSSDLKT